MKKIVRSKQIIYGGRFRKFLTEFTRSTVAAIAVGVLILLIIVAVAAPVIAPQDPYDLSTINIMDSRLPPGSISMDGNVMLLGSDGQGRDMLSALLYGLRTSLFVAVIAGLVAMTIGLVLGMLSAYRGGAIDALIMRIVDLQLAFPTILIALTLVAVLGQGVDKVIIALIVVQWAYYARTVRGAAMVEKNAEYIEAAKGLALPHWRILMRHLLPNCLPSLLVVAAVQAGHAIALEATLSFLGIGLPITEPSLGLLISNGLQFLMAGAYWISIYPGLLLLVTLMTINLVSDQLRDVLNPRLA